MICTAGEEVSIEVEVMKQDYLKIESLEYKVLEVFVLSEISTD